MRKITLWLPVGIATCLLALLSLFMSASFSVPAAAAPSLSARESQRLQEVSVVSANAQEINFEVGSLHFGETQILTTIADLGDPNQLAYQLALAMDITATNIITAEFMCSDDSGACTDPRAAAVLGIAPGTWFPTRDKSFALLSTGLATDVIHITTTAQVSTAELSNAGSDHGLDPLTKASTYFNNGFVLNGMTNTLQYDLVQFHLALQVPENAQCLSFDYTFYTTDIPSPLQSCSDPVGDLFTTQLNHSHITLTATAFGAQVEPPGNFVTYNGNLVSTTTMSPTGINEAILSPLGTTVPGIFPLLQARQQVSGGETIHLYFTIQDIGNSYGDSAVALDNFTWLAGGECETGVSGDKDGDGLPDGWEIYGKYTLNRANELKYFDLPLWGANPKIKDIFVEVDTMVFTDGLPYVSVYPGKVDPVRTQPIPLAQAISDVVEAFYNAPVDEIPSDDPTKPKEYLGIQLHVDYTQTIPPRWMSDAQARQQWSAISQGGILTATGLTRAFICADLCKTKWDDVWKEVQKIKYQQNQFADERMPIFHYALFAHMLSDCTAELYYSNSAVCMRLPRISGASNHITDMVHGGSDFVVTLGHSQWYTDNIQQRAVQQAGTFMHELGHNLGLNHAGTYADSIMYKPNHLSVMNYLYQTRGVLAEEPFKFDYSRYNFVDPYSLNESHLNESKGLFLDAYQSAFAITVPETISITHMCDGYTEYVTTEYRKGQPIHWNCKTDDLLEDFEYDISGYSERPEDVHTILAPLNEWQRLTFTGGLLNRQLSMINRYRSNTQDNLCFDNNPLWVIFRTVSGNRIYVSPQEVILPANDYMEELLPEKDFEIRGIPQIR